MKIQIWTLYTCPEDGERDIQVFGDEAAANLAAAKAVNDFTGNDEKSKNATPNNWRDVLDEYRGRHDRGEECYIECGYVDVPGILIATTDARILCDAAGSYADDLSTGLADGTYEDDPGLDKIEAAHKRLNAAIEAAYQTYRVEVLYQTESGNGGAAVVTVRASDEDHATDLAQAEVRADKRRKVMKINGGSVELVGG